MLKYLLPFLFPLALFSQSTQRSSIPLPTTYIYLIDNNGSCHEECLQRYLDEGQIFSFLALSEETGMSLELRDIRQQYFELFNISAMQEKLNIAMLLPHKRIGRYASSTSNALFSYLLTRNHPFVVKNFYIEDESAESIAQALEKIKDEGFKYIIAPMTQRGAQAVASQEKELTVFFPTMHKKDLNISAENIYFGAIDYQDQIEHLTTRATSPLVIFYGKSAKGKKLYAQTKEAYLQSSKPFQKTGRQAYCEKEGLEYNPKLEPRKKRVIAYAIDRKSSNLKWHLENNKKIQFGSFFLNTPVVKSTMILSQFTSYDTNTTNILSTQINYDPLMFSMTQAKDRKRMYIANSININNDTLIQANKLLSNDIVYDWINYTTTVGIDLFYHLITHEERYYPLPLKENQILYPVSIVQPVGTRFTIIEEGNITINDLNITDQNLSAKF